MVEEQSIDLLKELDDSYYNGTSIEDDFVYDKFKKKVQKKYPDNPYFKTVGAPVPDSSPWKTVKHSIPMGSIESIIGNDKDTFIESVLEQTRKWWVKMGKPEVLLQHKLDGLSVNLEYEKGKLVRAILRNDGVEGEDVFRNVKRMKNVPIDVNPDFTNIRCEIILFKKDLETINREQKALGEKLYANCRNAAAGICRRLDGKYSDNLTVLPFDVNQNRVKKIFDFVLLNQLEAESKCEVIHGFRLVPWASIKDPWLNIENAYRLLIQDRHNIPYDIDGAVIKFSRRWDRNDDSMIPNWIKAMKFPPEEKEFTADKINWFVGKTGHVTPVLWNEAGVQFSAKVVHEATLHNYNQFCIHKVAPGDKIAVSISGDVIPKVEGVIERSGNPMFEVPKVCPSCNSLLKVDGKFLTCEAEGCGGRIKALINAHVKIMDIEEIGPALVDNLYENGFISNYTGLYKLTTRDISSIEGYQQKSAQKVIDNIQSNREKDFPTFIASLGIPSIGRRIIEKTGIDNLDDLIKISLSDLKNIDGIGEITALKIKEGVDKCHYLIMELFQNGVTIKEKKETKKVSDALQGKAVCFTGDTKVPNLETGNTFTRPECQELVKEHGGVVKSGVSKKLDVLVLVDLNSQTSKSRKARELGIEMISDKQFFERVGVL